MSALGFLGDPVLRRTPVSLILPELETASTKAKRELTFSGLSVAAVWRLDAFDLAWDQSYSVSEFRQREPALGLSNTIELNNGERWFLQQLWLSTPADAENGAWRWQWGLDFGRRRSSFANRDELPLVELFPPEGGTQVSTGAARLLETTTEQVISRRAVQAWLSHPLSSQLDLELGFAYAREQREDAAGLRRKLTTASCTIQTRDGDARPCSVELPDIARVNTARQAESLFTPALTLSYRSPWGTFASQWRRGARSGGARPFAGTIRGFKAERSETYELSWRIDRVEALQARLAMFYNDWRDRQVQLVEPGQAGFAIANAGAAHAFGAEWQMHWNFARQWQAGLGLGWLKTRFDRFPVAGPGGLTELSGNQFVRAPRYTALLHVLRAPEQGWQWGATWTLADEAEGDVYNRPGTRLPGFHNLDLRLAWQGKRWRVAAQLENALDRQVLEHVEASLISPEPRALIFAPRRSVSVEWSLEW